MNEISRVKNESRRQQWVELLRRRQESGMTVVKFCEANEIKAKTYYYWRQKLQEDVCRQAVVAVPVQPEAEEMCGAGMVKLRAGGLVVEIGDGASAVTIEAVVRALREQC